MDLNAFKIRAIRKSILLLIMNARTNHMQNETMQKRRVTLPDGRYLIYYDFDDEPEAAVESAQNVENDAKEQGRNSDERADPS